VIHIRCAKAFFLNLNEIPPNTVTVNFDLMQNQPLPKTNIGEAYYSRQVWFYLLGIVIHDTKKLNKETVHFYRWLQCDRGRGPNKLATCLADFFMKSILSFHDKGVK
jgi:hypothetical protein